MINAVAVESGLKVEFVTTSFSGLIGVLRSGRIDTIANQITITLDLKPTFAFTQP